MAKSTFHFSEKASSPKNAIALIFDLEGFSAFFNQPDVQDYVPAFLNHISETISVVLFGGKAYWQKAADVNALKVSVAHEKYLGDGALYVLLPPAGSNDFTAAHLSALCNRLFNLKNNFDAVINSVLAKVPVAELPKKIRFGISRGSVYELGRTDGLPPEYIGYCINLASRLQTYCRDLGFIASARLMIPDADLKRHGYKKVIATKLKGFSKEIVIVDSSEFAELNEITKADLFAELGQD